MNGENISRRSGALEIDWSDSSLSVVDRSRNEIILQVRAHPQSMRRPPEELKRFLSEIVSAWVDGVAGA